MSSNARNPEDVLLNNNAVNENKLVCSALD